MKILIISQYFSPDITAAAYRIGDTYRILKEFGHDVYVITTKPHKGGHDSLHADDETDEKIYRIDVSRNFINPIISYLYQYFYFAFRALLQALIIRNKFKYEVVLVTSPPLFIGLCSSFIKILTKAKVVFDVRDIWPESAINIGVLKRGSLVERFGRILEWVSYAFADELTCVSEPMKSYLESKTKHRVTVIYNGVSASFLGVNGPDEQTEPDPNVFCYAGNIGRAQDIAGLLKAFAIALENPVMHSCRLVMIGTGALIDEVKEDAERLLIAERVKFLGVRPKPEAFFLMKQAGTLLIPLLDSPAFRLTVPSKIFDYMALNRPIISNILGEGHDILESTGANILVTPGDLNEMANAFIRMRSEWHTYFQKAHVHKDKVTCEYSREKSVSDLAKIFERLLG